VVLPYANRRHVEEIDRSLRRDVEFVLARHVQEVFDAVLVGEPPRAGRPPRTLVPEASPEPVLTPG
jgi:ATP-dependent Lon protease